MSGDFQDGLPLFPETFWPLVRRAGAEGEEGQREALEELLRNYLPALRAHLVHRKSVRRHEADDFVQGFITDKILHRDLLASADRERGKFRTLLLTALDRYVVSQRRYQKAQKRSAERAVSLDPEKHGHLATGAETPSDPFDVAWARQVLGETVRRMRTECEGSGRPEIWGVFDARLLAPSVRGEEPVSYGQLVAKFGLSTPREASNVLITGKRMFARVLRAVVGEYTPADEVDGEIRELQAALSGCGGRETPPEKAEAIGAD
jgi:RNA polymerase sigma-70 factor (ECF subfamily)